MEKYMHLKKYYEFAMSFLAIIVSALIVIEFTTDLSQEILNVFNIINNIILIIFSADYFTRLILAKDKLYFIKHNVIDLIAIIPFSSIFQATRLVRLVRLARFLKILRLLTFLVLLYKRIERFLRTNNFHYVLWVTLSTIIIGAVCISFAEEMAFGNAIWWAFVTTTTVGYGDISPSTPFGRIVAVFLMIIGIGFIGMLTGTISTYFITKKESHKTFGMEVIDSVKQKLDNFDQLEMKEIDEIYGILKALKQTKT